MPIAISTTPHDLLSANRQFNDNLRGMGLRDSKGIGIRFGARVAGIRSLGKNLGFSGGTADSRLANSTNTLAKAQKSFFARMPQEPEDARLTGITRSLARRLLALNLPGSLRARPVMRVEASGLVDKFA